MPALSPVEHGRDRLSVPAPTARSSALRQQPLGEIRRPTLCSVKFRLVEDTESATVSLRRVEGLNLCPAAGDWPAESHRGQWLTGRAPRAERGIGPRQDLHGPERSGSCRRPGDIPGAASNGDDHLSQIEYGSRLDDIRRGSGRACRLVTLVSPVNENRAADKDDSTL